MIENSGGCILVKCMVRMHENYGLVFFLTQDYLKGRGRGFSLPIKFFNLCLGVLNTDVEIMDAYCKFPSCFLPQPHPSIGSSGTCSMQAFCQTSVIICTNQIFSGDNCTFIP